MLAFPAVDEDKTLYFERDDNMTPMFHACVSMMYSVILNQENYGVSVLAVP